MKEKLRVYLPMLLKNITNRKSIFEEKFKIW